MAVQVQWSDTWFCAVHSADSLVCLQSGLFENLKSWRFAALSRQVRQLILPLPNEAFNRTADKNFEVRLFAQRIIHVRDRQKMKVI